jgi:anti-sigma factor RsiW
MPIDDETLMAYADGILSGEEARAVERAMAADEALAARVAALADARRAVKAAHAAPPAVPAELLARVRGLAEADARRRAAEGPPKVVDLASRRRQVPFWQLPLAASVALVAGGLAGWLAAPASGPQPGQAAGFAVADLADPAIAGALDRVASGERVALEGGAELAAIATFRDGGGTLCREFEYDRDPQTTLVAVACRGEAAWDLRLAVVAPGAGADGYAPASSLETLDAFLSATGAEPPLSPEDERAALDGLR